MNPFDWHPEPDLVDTTNPETSRPALTELGEAAWGELLSYLFDEALDHVTTPLTYPELRHRFYGESRAEAEAHGEPGGDGLHPAPAPRAPRPSAEVLAEFRARLAPQQFNAQHPRAFAYFTPPPLLMSVVGELLTQVMNQGVDVWHSGPTAAFVEEEVVSWLREVVGFDSRGFGVLTSGGVMANIMAMTLARDIHLPKLLAARDGRTLAADGRLESGARPEPARGSALEGVRVYASDQTHFSIARALDILGFPPETLHVVPSDEGFRLHGAPVAAAIAEDRAAGFLPLAISAVSGSTNTGSVDLVGELADIAEREGLWLHVDAAYGGAARLSPRDAGRVPDLERADSVTVDPHKWFFQACDIGALVVKRREDLHDTFHRAPEYYRHARPEETPLHWYQHSMEGTRRFRGLKLWMSWKHLGSEGLARLVEMNDDLAAYLATKIAESDDFEAIPAVPELSVVCFRHLPGGREAAHALDAADPSALDRHQDRLQRALEVSGDAWISTTKLRGRTFLRAGIVNYLAREADIDRLLADLRAIAARIEAEDAAGGTGPLPGEGDETFDEPFAESVTETP